MLNIYFVSDLSVASLIATPLFANNTALLFRYRVPEGESAIASVGGRWE